MNCVDCRGWIRATIFSRKAPCSMMLASSEYRRMIGSPKKNSTTISTTETAVPSTCVRRE